MERTAEGEALLHVSQLQASQNATFDSAEAGISPPWGTSSAGRRDALNLGIENIRMAREASPSDVGPCEMKLAQPLLYTVTMKTYVMCLGRKAIRRRLVRVLQVKRVDAAAADGTMAITRLLRERGLPRLILAESLSHVRSAREIHPCLYAIPAQVIEQRSGA